MPITRLREDLERLRAEIARSEGGDADALERLNELAARVEQEIAEESVIGDPMALVEEIEESVTGFEASHPNLAAILNNMISILHSIGV